MFVDDNPYVYIGIITLSLGFNGASTMTNLQNSQDLAPNFAGTVYGVINFCGTSTGFITPMVVGAFTAESVSYKLQSKAVHFLSNSYLFPLTEHNRSLAQYIHCGCCSLYITCHNIRLFRVW
jgi:hypothetical protein